MQAKEPGRSSGGSELPARRAGHGTPPTRAAQPDRPAPAAVGSTRSVRRRLLQPGPRRALLLLLLAGAAVLRWYDLHPIVWKPAELLTSGEALLHPVPADLLLVVDPAAVRRAAARGRSFAQADWSYGWYNFAVQELGWVAVLALQTLGPLDLAGRRAVVVTRSAVASALPHLAELAAFVEKGGLLLLEQPDDGWQQLTGVRGLGALQPAGPLSGTLIEQGYPELLRMPTPTQLLPLDCAARGAGERAGQAAPAPAPGGAEVLLRSDGQPAACLRRVGHGAVVTLGLDVGRLITALQQGMPDPGGFRVSNRYPDRLSRHLESSDLVADPRLLDNPVPFADLLETLLASLLDRGNGPLPRWWGFPAGMAGAYLVTHDEEGVGDKAAWMAEAESRWGVRSTYFLMPGPGPSPAGLSTIRSAAALGLHWNKLDDPDEEGLEKLGWGPIRPLARMSTLVEQAGWLAGLTGQPPRLNRNHFLLWDAGWAEPFRKLSAVGVELDSTYGPDVACRGYLFATGRPFLALDEQGLPLRTWELPFQLAEDLGGADRAYLMRLLEESSTLYHVAVVPLFHPNAFGWHPSAAVFLTFAAAFEEARRRALWIADLAEYADFEKARRASALRSTWDGDVLRIQGVAERAELTLALPRRWAGRQLARVALNGREVQPLSRPGRGGPWALLVLPAGRQRVELAYGRERR